MAITVSYVSQVKVVETIANNTDSISASDQTVTHDAFKTAQTLKASSTPPATKTANFVQALSTGTATIDLTSLTGTNGATVDGSGLKVQVLKMKNLGANTMSLAVGASNGYDLSGSDFKVTLSQNQEVTLYGNDATPDIAGADAELDLAGTASQTCEITIVMG